MGFRMTRRQIWVEVALPQQFSKQKMTLKNVQDCLLLSYMEGFWTKKNFVLYMM